jgi:hypothetical protein
MEEYQSWTINRSLEPKPKGLSLEFFFWHGHLDGNSGLQETDENRAARVRNDYRKSRRLEAAGIELTIARLRP